MNQSRSKKDFLKDFGNSDFLPYLTSWEGFFICNQLLRFHLSIFNNIHLENINFLQCGL